MAGMFGAITATYKYRKKEIYVGYKMWKILQKKNRTRILNTRDCKLTLQLMHQVSGRSTEQFLLPRDEVKELNHVKATKVKS